MKSYTRLFILALVLSVWGLACTAKSIEPKVTQQGYTVSLDTAPDPIWFGSQVITTPNVYLGFGEMVVQVHNAQGNPVEGVPVAFETEPSWANSATIKPPRVLTRNGMARALFIPDTNGVAQVMARVDDVTLNATFYVESITHGNSTAMPDLQGLPYPPY